MDGSDNFNVNIWKKQQSYKRKKQENGIIQQKSNIQGKYEGNSYVFTSSRPYDDYEKHQSNLDRKITTQKANESTESEKDSKLKVNFDNLMYEDSIKRRRTTMTPEQTKILKDCFIGNIFPSAQIRNILSKKTGLTPKSVQIWFQNQRQKAKGMENSFVKIIYKNVKDKRFKNTFALDVLAEVCSYEYMFRKEHKKDEGNDDCNCNSNKDISCYKCNTNVEKYTLMENNNEKINVKQTINNIINYKNENPENDTKKYDNTSQSHDYDKNIRM